MEKKKRTKKERKVLVSYGEKSMISCMKEVIRNHGNPCKEQE
ncbi:MAG: hypothetical protein PUB46_08875 [Lachnospiraceae bacterium]|nr:hypothetical protein [Lachnospiraceae bacterium]MDY4840260.1 hypothetical protein [Lachnospiraceae bacterium]